MKLTKIRSYLFKSKNSIETMYWNLWNQYGINKNNCSSLKVKNYLWSEKAKKDFYSFPLHKKLILNIKQRGLLEEWEFSCEPKISNL